MSEDSVERFLQVQRTFAEMLENLYDRQCEQLQKL